MAKKQTEWQRLRAEVDALRAGPKPKPKAKPKAKKTG